MFCYCAESRRVARLLTLQYDLLLAQAGLSVAQFELLSTLRELELVNGRALAEQLALDPTTLSRNLKVLVKDKLVAARRSGIDARQTDYSLTAKGSKRLEVARPLWQQADAAARMTMGVDADSLQHTLRSTAERLRA